MSNLTEKWNKGELSDGFYFVDDGAEITIDYYFCDYWERHFDSDVKQVLAPVPSYGELQNMNKAVNECMAANIKLVEQNRKLKELLKECREHFITYKRDDLDKGYVVYDGSYLTAKINQVLGEE